LDCPAAGNAFGLMQCGTRGFQMELFVASAVVISAMSQTGQN
jgi:hypothetical protein